MKLMVDNRNKVEADSGVSLLKTSMLKRKLKPKNVLIKPFKCPKQRHPPRKHYL